MLHDHIASHIPSLYFLQGDQRQINPSGDLEDEQGTRDIAVLHPGQDMEFGLPPESLLPESLFWSRDSGPKTFNPYSRNPYHLVLSDANDPRMSFMAGAS